MVEKIEKKARSLSAVRLPGIKGIMNPVYGAGFKPLEMECYWNLKGSASLSTDRATKLDVEEVTQKVASHST